jgi:hypothetical protein
MRLLSCVVTKKEGILEKGTTGLPVSRGMTGQNLVSDERAFCLNEHKQEDAG